ncbi:hypothetical protein ACSI5F_03660 [Ralstonia pseudosolanacearum]|uniref:hypothetical protein n=1 Tax=Ralstonia pseudosolanacearum TaxID=1310165 RepID=UPI003EE1DDDC
MHDVSNPYGSGTTLGEEWRRGFTGRGVTWHADSAGVRAWKEGCAARKAAVAKLPITEAQRNRLEELTALMTKGQS